MMSENEENWEVLGEFLYQDLGIFGVLMKGFMFES